jgi:hypothetical protein
MLLALRSCYMYMSSFNAAHNVVQSSVFAVSQDEVSLTPPLGWYLVLLVTSLTHRAVLTL